MVERTINGKDQGYLMDAPAWWGGERITYTGARYAEEVIELSNLDWPVETAPAYLFIDGEYRRVPGQVGTYRVTDGKIFTSGLGQGYTPIQNRECFKILNELVQSDEVVIETAISLKGGARVVIVARRPDHVLFGGERYDDYLVAATGHDGGHALQLFSTKVRIVCQNTLSYAKETTRRIYKIRHTATYGERIQQARNALEMSFDSTEDTRELANEMLAQKMTDREWFALMDRLWELPEEQGRAYTNRLNNREEASAIYFGEDNLNDIRGTRWGGLQAMIQWNDWVKGSTKDHTLFKRTVEGQSPEVNKTLEFLAR